MRKPLIAAAVVLGLLFGGPAAAVLFLAIHAAGAGAAQASTAGPGGSTLKPGKVPAAYEPIIIAAGSLCPALSPPVLAAQLDLESGHFDPAVIAGQRLSSAGAVGVGQFLPSTWATYGIDANEDGSASITDPVDSIWSAAGYDCALAAEVHAGSDPRPMLAAYNAGPGNMPAGQGYADQVLSVAKDWTQPIPTVDTAGLPGPTAGGCALPIAGAVETAPFGQQRPGHIHAGVDLAAPNGTPIGPACPGVVAYAGPASGYGNYVCVQHPGAVATCYAHMSQIMVTVGQTVAVGQVLGLEGATGDATGPHLHFEVRTPGVWGTPQDPIPWLAALGLHV